nr:uncharacterized protein LOC104007321 isoform X4 [Pan troglodytes]
MERKEKIIKHIHTIPRFLKWLSQLYYSTMEEIQRSTNPGPLNNGSGFTNSVLAATLWNKTIVDNENSLRPLFKKFTAVTLVPFVETEQSLTFLDSTHKRDHAIFVFQ